MEVEVVEARSSRIVKTAEAMAVPAEVPDDHEGAADGMTDHLEKVRDLRQRKVMTVAITKITRTEIVGKNHIAWSMIVRAGDLFLDQGGGHIIRQAGIIRGVWTL